MILDTSVLFDTVIEGDRSPAARDLVLETELLSAPDLIRIELAGALTRAVRRKYISADHARAAMVLADGLLPELESSLGLTQRAFELSLDLVHPCSDCVFLALAEREGRPLATADARFANKLTGTPYARLVHLIEP